MSLRITVNDAAGRREYEPGELPLALGTGPGAELRVPGPGSTETLALLSELDGAPFIQATARETPVTVNGEPLSGSRRLANGDEIALYGSRIACRYEDGRLTLDVSLEDSVYVTEPPQMPAGAGAEEEDIEPVAWRAKGELPPPAAGPGGALWRYAVGAALVALAGLAWLLFTSVSVRFEVEPVAPETLAIEGGWFRLPLADRYLLRPGSYTVRVETPGYRPVSRRFEVGDESDLTLLIEQEKLPGRLRLSSEPAAGATVRLGDEALGETPLVTGTLEPGVYDLELRAERYLPWRGPIEVLGLGKVQDVEVQLVPAWAPVELRSKPAGAVIYAGEAELGATPAIVDLPEGEHRLTVMLEGYKPWEAEVTAFANVPQTLPLIELEEADGVLTVETRPSGANITVDGRYRGQSPVKLALAPGETYDIGLSKAGYGKQTRRVRLRAAEGQTLRVDLAARTGQIVLAVEPPGATVFVNGRRHGTGSATLELPATPQRIEVKAEGYESWERTITPRPGFPQAVTARLRSADEVRLAAIQQIVTTSQGQELRYIDPGVFTMGASRREPGRRANETLRRVQLTRGYYIGTKEVTNREFRVFNELHDSGAEVAAALAGDNNPAMRVTWEQAVSYCNWLSAREGLDPAYVEKFGKLVPAERPTNGYRLPTEAEWAWMARYLGGKGRLKYPWGQSMPPPKDSGNYADQSASEMVPTVLPSYDDGFAVSAPVGSFPPNALGIYDVGGNAAEWVQDFYAVYTPGADQLIVDPVGPPHASHHVIRGSSWRHAGITQLRLSYRDFGSAPRDDVGFRIARYADAGPAVAQSQASRAEGRTEGQAE